MTVKNDSTNDRVEIVNQLAKDAVKAMATYGNKQKGSFSGFKEDWPTDQDLYLHCCFNNLIDFTRAAHGIKLIMNPEIF